MGPCLRAPNVDFKLTCVSNIKCYLLRLCKKSAVDIAFSPEFSRLFNDMKNTANQKAGREWDIRRHPRHPVVFFRLCF